MTRSRQTGIYRQLSFLMLGIAVSACNSGVSRVRASTDEEQFFRRLDQVLHTQIAENPALDPAEVAALFRGQITQTSVPLRRAAEIQYQVIAANARAIPNAAMFQHHLAEEVFRNDTVGFLLAVGYSYLLELSTPSQRALYHDLVKKLEPLVLRNARTFTSTYREKADIASLLHSVLDKNVISEQQVLLILHLALSDVYGQVSLKSPQVDMLLRLVFFRHDSAATQDRRADAEIQRRISGHIEFIETLLELQKSDWNKKSGILRLLDHYHGGLGPAIQFVLKHGWGAGTGNMIDDVYFIGRHLDKYSTQEILEAFERMPWAAGDFAPSDPQSYAGGNGMVLELLFSKGTPQRDIPFPLPGIERGRPESVRDAARVFAQLKDVLGSWEHVMIAVQAGNAGLVPHMIASLIYLFGDELGWGQLALAAGADPGVMITAADILFGAGEGWPRFMNTTAWRTLTPVAQLVALAETLDSDCLEGYRQLTPLLAGAIEASPERNRMYIAGGWSEIPDDKACGFKGAGRGLFVGVFLTEWSGGSPLRAVTFLSNALGKPRTEVFDFLADSDFSGMSRQAFTRRYVIEDIDAKRDLLGVGVAPD